MNRTAIEYASDLLQFIDHSPSAFHAAHQCTVLLDEAGFQALELSEPWQLQPGGRYYVCRNHTTVIAFVLGLGSPAEHGFRMVAAHTDSPNFKLKTRPEMRAQGNYLRLNTEVYGAPIYHTWLDRPLSVAGRVSLRSDNLLYPENRLLKIDRPILYIPNLAIHFQRDINEGRAYNPQVDMLPVLGHIDQALPDAKQFYRLLAQELNVEPDRILDFDLHLWETTPGCFVGQNQEFISTGQIDNLAMVHAGITALAAARPTQATQLMVCFDNEEVGSLTKQGASSPLLKQLLERVVFKTGGNAEDYQRALYQSFMISADMAHAVHPNLPEVHDPVLRPQLNQGPVVKIHAGQKYTSDSDSVAVYEAICQQAGVPYQKFVNRSDLRGGSTLGNLSAAQVDVRSVDIGNPMLAMHSVREMAGTLDHAYIRRSFDLYYAQ